YVDGYGDAFIMRIDASQSGSASLLSSTYLGGSDTDIGAAITLDRQNNIYVTGWTSPFPFGNTPFPHTASAPQLIKPGAADDFIAKVTPTATQLVYGTYLGGSSNDLGLAIAVDGDNNAYVSGYTDSTSGFPTNSGYQTSNQGGIDAFVTKLNASGTAWGY